MQSPASYVVVLNSPNVPNAGGIAEFYTTILGVDARLSSDNKTCIVRFETPPQKDAESNVAQRQLLVFKESADAQPRDNYDRTDTARFVHHLLLCQVCVHSVPTSSCGIAHTHTRKHTHILKYNQAVIDAAVLVCRYHIAIYLPTDEHYEAAFERAKAQSTFYCSPLLQVLGTP